MARLASSLAAHCEAGRGPRACWALLFLAMLGGCAAGQSGSSGKAHRSTLNELRAQARTIELCRTGEQELRRLFGEPMRDGRFHRHRMLSWLLASGNVERVLAVLVDEGGVVADIFFDSPGVANWVPHSQCNEATSRPAD